MIRLYLKILEKFVCLIFKCILGCAFDRIGKFKLVAQFPWDHLSHPVMTSLILFSLQHSLIMWLIVSSLSPHNLHLLFCCIMSILTSTSLVLIMLFCDAVIRDSVSLTRFPFLSHVQVFSCLISLVCHLKYLYCCFSSYFCFLVIFVLLILVLSVLFQIAVISLPLRFFL